MSQNRQEFVVLPAVRVNVESFAPQGHTVTNRNRPDLRYGKESSITMT